ncbi:hypothetical protein COOONC_03890, partial [Cooperia oncophora]
MPRIRYLGSIIDKAGRHPDLEKVEAIQIPALKIVAEVLITDHLWQKCVRIRAPLDELLKKNSSFHWTNKCEEAFQRAKDIHAPLDELLKKNSSFHWTNKCEEAFQRAKDMLASGYDFTLEYRSTTEFGQADALSRLIPPRPDQSEDVVIAKIEQDILAVYEATLHALPVTRDSIQEESIPKSL